MSRVVKIRSDSIGLFIKEQGCIFRPGAITEYSDRCNMSDGGLKLGDMVRIYHAPGSFICRVVCPDGTILRWGNSHLHEQETLRQQKD